MNNITFTGAQQARAVYNFKNTKKKKLSGTKTAVWYNNVCKISPIYKQVMVSGNIGQAGILTF
jgi:hypothetical protein